MKSDERSLSWSLYLIRTRSSQLYTGITTDVQRRFNEHQQGGRKAAKFLKGKTPLTLVYSCQIGSRSEALRWEYQVKQWPKSRKEALVVAQLPLQQF
ncbi:GIY-YIG nuclease family protein [Celerinatantimonas sp. YJH-8]|uniref:GIY-YIG nuclease family protein n=1 Tax=Celerinatantimonas sp. YJH-8 TaxID=3228714 RepID=UPI0038C14CA6